ncbi:MAG: EamA family transporter [Candidatus Aenigmarchaeota archaeon]|nr:EamA family transporter [Candidatus Aenigmarchaeota archaeon]
MKIDKRLIYVSLFSIFWTLEVFFTKLALNKGADSLTLSLQNMVFGGIILLSYILIFKRNRIKDLRKKYSLRIFLMGVLLTTGYLLSIYGLNLSTSVNYGFLIKATVVFTPLLGFLFLKENFNKKKLFLLLTFLLGAYLMTIGINKIVPRIGDILIIGAAFFFSLTLIIQKPLTNNIDPNIVSISRIIVSSFLLILMFLFFSSSKFKIQTPIYGILIAFSFAINEVFLSKSLSVSTVSYFSMISMSVPVIVSVLGLIFLGETVSIFQVIGGIIIIVSGILVQKSKI